MSVAVDHGPPHQIKQVSKQIQPQMHADEAVKYPQSSKLLGASACICVHLRLKFLTALHSFQTSRSADHSRQPVVDIRRTNPAAWNRDTGHQALDSIP